MILNINIILKLKNVIYLNFKKMTDHLIDFLNYNHEIKKLED